MFHIVGITPEAPSVEVASGGGVPRRRITVHRSDLARAWRELDSSPEEAVQLISLGNPHFSITECQRLAELCSGREKCPDTEVVVTMGRHINEQANEAGYLAILRDFGATLITDTCWCMLGEPVIPEKTSTLMTNSGKYAHYAPGLVGRRVRFGSLADCVEVACTGRRETKLPTWLS